MVIVNSTSAHVFTALPQEEVENGEQELNGTTDQILDGLLSKVGYGLFQKKLLVRTPSTSNTTYLKHMPVILDIMWVWMVSGQCKLLKQVLKTMLY
jgi:hypothetical protein